MLDNVILTSIKSVNVIPTRKGRYVEVESRETYGLSFSLGEGRICYDHGGKKTYSDKFCAVIIPKGATYNLKNEEGGDFPIINFDVLGNFTDKFISIHISSLGPYVDDFFALQKQFQINGNSAKVFSIFYSLLARLANEGKSKPSVLDIAVEFIHKHISDPELSNDSLSELINVSEVYFRKSFKARFGESPKQYILNLRVSKAKEMLSEGVSSIGDIAELCGFSSPYHFSRMFKLLTGKTPTEYRGK